MAGADLVDHGLPVRADLREVLLGNAPLGNRLNHVVNGVLVRLIEIGDEQHVGALLHDMARLKRLVYDSVVVNLAENEPLLGNEFPLLAMTDLLDGGGFDLKTGVSKVRRRVAVDGILKEVFLNGIAERPTTTVGVGQLGSIGHLAQRLAHKLAGVLDDRLDVGWVVTSLACCHDLPPCFSDFRGQCTSRQLCASSDLSLIRQRSAPSRLKRAKDGLQVARDAGVIAA